MAVFVGRAVIKLCIYASFLGIYAFVNLCFWSFDCNDSDLGFSFFASSQFWIIRICQYVIFLFNFITFTKNNSIRLHFEMLNVLIHLNKYC
ncbi:unnamed protein product [Blepharisma stoltei]|uniref:Uncharacterized protein n=1 Tax=Blepharisma stoltei TaxID=1481888 RepID=A0AAU9K4C7_9CILI|nr:unnamed protein product [Blepharisma stoltei]